MVASAPMKQSTLTNEQRMFLERVSLGDTVNEACTYAGIDRLVAVEWQKEDDFSVRMKLAMDDAADLLEAEARRRAMNGVEKVFKRGDSVVTETVYSDSLMMFVLKGRRPEVYGDKLETVSKVTIESGPSLQDQILSWAVAEGPVKPTVKPH